MGRNRSIVSRNKHETENHLLIRHIKSLKQLVQVETLFLPQLVIHRGGMLPFNIRILVECGQGVELRTTALIHVVVGTVQRNPVCTSGYFRLDIANHLVTAETAHRRIDISNVHEFQRIEIHVHRREVNRVERYCIRRVLRPGHLDSPLATRHNGVLGANRRRAGQRIVHWSARFEILIEVLIDLCVRHKCRQRKNQAQ